MEERAFVSSYRRFVVVPVSLLVLSAALAGCKLPKGPHPDQIVGAPPDTISIYQLAGRLGLNVVQSDRTVAHLRGPRDTVTVYADPGGSIFVNGRPLASPGPLATANGTIFVPPGVLGPIRTMFRAVPAPPAPEPVRPTLPVRGPTRRVVLDPGHGGKDPGTTACRDAPEKTIVLAVARGVRDRLTAAGVDVVMTRDDDQFVELEDRAAISNRSACDLFVAVHADSTARSAVCGHTVYVAGGAGKATLAAADYLDCQLGAVTGCSRGLRRAEYRVLVKNERPAVLVEIGYLSNRSEAARLCSRAYQVRLAEAIADGILDALKP